MKIALSLVLLCFLSPEINSQNNTATAADETKPESNGVVINVSQLSKNGHNKARAQKIVSNYIKAIGGKENVTDIKTLYQKTRTTGKTFYGGTESNMDAVIEINYKEPNNYWSETYSGGKSNYNLFLNGSVYQKLNKEDEWDFIYENKALSGNASMYINEYYWLLNNDDILYLGEKYFEEVACHAIRLPDVNLNEEQDLFSYISKIKTTNFYSIETQLYVGSESDVRFVSDYKENSEYLKDSYTSTKSTTTVSDYKEYDGVLMYTVSTNRTVADDMKSETVTEYLEIKINPEINPADFNVNKQ